ncbi:hypothetical protein CC85DRAFT_80865 [Cutaneotrichosporon oleaginosum]|uniref:Uncharacterized protein n=1 Tax=Cutaneotrichosporon oleaginosum TaxID=879819 RepID=A0A0J0XNE1_9TREE|nr:uncharacterized protein CC85DRAFT_80865 [Cutaneotrichosporon oleaginosum]KLT42635.1 hypothetical protein CC85DRAFT_80865 [Cutaneotrichosporon oleaginosum]TXT05248.1 hypothetical protein COLE_06568 [Cutaneotrichosporon oleaginosum]
MALSSCLLSATETSELGARRTVAGVAEMPRCRGSGRRCPRNQLIVSALTAGGIVIGLNTSQLAGLSRPGNKNEPRLGCHVATQDCR